MRPLLEAIAALQPPGDAGRVFHGRGGRHPGCEHWSLDAFAPVWLLTSFRPATEEELAAVHAALAERWAQIGAGAPLCWVHQCRHEGRTQTRLMSGAVPDPHEVTEHGARYLVHLLRGQNHGLFLDMAAGRAWVRDHVAARPGLKVLNLFAYTCAFSVVARLAGAADVTNLDMSGGALSIGRQNHRLNGVEQGVRFLAHDLFNSWGKITRQGPYDLVILDPPSYQKGSFVANKDYARLLRRLPDLLAPGGQALLCLNAPELPLSFLTERMAVEAPGLVFVERVANPPIFDDVSADRSLKVLVYRAPADGATHQALAPPSTP